MSWMCLDKTPLKDPCWKSCVFMLYIYVVNFMFLKIVHDDKKWLCFFHTAGTHRGSCEVTMATLACSLVGLVALCWWCWLPWVTMFGRCWVTFYIIYIHAFYAKPRTEMDKLPRKCRSGSIHCTVVLFNRITCI